MSGSKINDYAIGDQNIQSVMLTLDKAFKGFHQASLTNYNTTDESAIAAGSVVEVNGALYKFDSDESITGSPSDGTVYIQLVPSGDTITAAYTNTAPTWSDSKQGWYGTGGSANYRYLEFIFIKTGSNWVYKDLIKQSFKKTYFDLYEYFRIYLYIYNIRFKHATSQSFPSSANGQTLLELNQTVTDTDLILWNNSTYRFYTKGLIAGDYLISGTYTESDVNGRTLSCRISGGSYVALLPNGIGGKSFTDVAIKMTATDYLEFYINNSGGVAFTATVDITIKKSIL